MKQFLKFIGFCLLAFVLIVIGFFIFHLFGNNEHRAPVSIIPTDAIIIVETENVSELLKEVTQSDYWYSIVEGDVFHKVKKGLVSFDETLEENKWLMPILRNQKIAFSWHQISDCQNDFVIVVDVKKYGNFNLAPKIASAFKLPIKSHVVDSLQLHSITLKELNQTIHLVSIDNLLIGSSSFQLLEKIIIERSKNHIEANDERSQGYSLLNKGQINIYANINKIKEAFLNRSKNQFLKGISHTALGGNFSQSSFKLDGFSSCDNTVSSLFIPLLKSKTGNREAEKVIPSSALFYLNFNVKDFNKFYSDFLVQYSSLDPIGYTTYMAGMKITESYLDVNVKEDILSWISGEIAMAKLRPVSNAREFDFILAVKSNDIKSAKNKLGDISKKIKNRTAVKFKKLNYKNHEINYLNIRGFFKVLMGNYFVNKEKPYYTIVDNYVVFSNASDILMQVIDSYIVGNTLQRNESFKNFNEELCENSHITAFVNMHRLYEHLYYYGNTKDRDNIKRYQDLFQKIGLMGMQMYPENNLLRTKLITKTDTSDILNLKLERISMSAEELVVDEFEGLDFKIYLSNEFDGFSGDLSYYLTHPQKVQDSVLVYEGMLEEGVLQGLWITYFYSGNVKSVVRYNEGFVDGTAFFYFDNSEHIIRAEIELSEDIIDGDYKEFYINGNIKANIKFKNGIRWGDALFYYRNGMMKIDGQYKKGQRSGNWRYYSKSGELLKKENW